MQTRLILRLARKIRSTYKKRKSWRVAAEVCRVHDPHGNPSPGLAFQIAECGLMPSQDLIARLIYDGAIDKPKPRPLDLSPQQRRAILLALRERKPLPAPTPRTIREFNDWLDTRGSCAR